MGRRSAPCTAPRRSRGRRRRSHPTVPWTHSSRKILHLPGRGVDEDVFDVDEELTEPLLAPEPRERRGEVTLIEVGSVMPRDEPRARRLDGRAERLARIDAHVVSASNERSRQGANGVDVPRERHRREQEAGHATQDAPRNRIPPPGASQTARPPAIRTAKQPSRRVPATGPLRASPDHESLAIASRQRPSRPLKDRSPGRWRWSADVGRRSECAQDVFEGRGEQFLVSSRGWPRRAASGVSRNGSGRSSTPAHSAAGESPRRCRCGKP